MHRRSLTFRRNNLDLSSSPYLLQHAGNPIWWQEWTGDVIKYAVETGKPVFVSVGYSTCHWCHVMAEGAFSHHETAYFMNEHFVCIKVDREQRPDIDQMMMDFINRQNGSGGWPLNVFLTPGLRPVYALTFAPADDTSAMYSFLSIAKKIHEFLRIDSEKVPGFEPVVNKPRIISENSLIRVLSDYYDPANGGFGHAQKFPPHSTLLYLLYQLSLDDSPSIKTICLKTLDSMMMRGLNDHLQGGIFRYCVDPAWNIPHFEKMLYDQAMALWTYSLAARVTAINKYTRMAEKILRCLDESFDVKGFYITALDADTDHQEGMTYLWSYDELTEILGKNEMEKFTEAYYVNISGNFEGKNHLVRRSDLEIPETEEKLLRIRKTRKQPFRDEKILSGLNALAAIALVHAARYLDRPSLEGKASSLVRRILKTFWKNNILGHSLYKGIVQDQPFLYDAAALLYAVTLLAETDTGWLQPMDMLAVYMNSFREGDNWLESKPSDFPPVYASWFDHPVPSSVSLAETALARYGFLKGKDVSLTEYRQPFQSDFFNINAMVRNGLFHVYTSVDVIDWNVIPPNSIQTRGIHEQDCFMGVCSPLSLHGTSL